MYYTVLNQREGNHVAMAVSTLSVRLGVLPGFTLTLYINLRLSNKVEDMKGEATFRQGD